MAEKNNDGEDKSLMRPSIKETNDQNGRPNKELTLTWHDVRVKVASTAASKFFKQASGKRTEIIKNGRIKAYCDC